MNSVYTLHAQYIHTYAQRSIDIYVFPDLMPFRRWAGSPGLRSTLRSVGANSGFARVGLLRAPLGRTSLRPAEPAHPRCPAARQKRSQEAPGGGAVRRAPGAPPKNAMRKKAAMPAAVQDTGTGRQTRCAISPPSRSRSTRERAPDAWRTASRRSPPRGELSGGAEELQPSYPENPSSTERSSTGWSAASVASWSQRSFSGCPACPLTHTKRTE